MFYDAAGNKVRNIDRNGRKTEFDYDYANQLRVERWLDSSNNVVNVIEQSTDDIGRVTGISDATTAISFAFSNDAGDRLTDQSLTYAGQPTVSIAHQPDALGRPLTTELRVGRGPVLVRNTYTRSLTTDRVTSIRQDGTFVADKSIAIQYSSSLANRVSSIQRSNASGTTISTSSISYDTRGNVSSIQHRAASQPIQSYSYSYNASNQVETVTDNSGTANYSYDALHRLSGVDYTGLNSDESYSYDRSGNPTSTATSSSFVIGTDNQVLSDGVRNYKYDNEGNLIEVKTIASGAVREFVWDHRNRLAALTDRNSSGDIVQQSTYVYDGLDRRVRQTVSQAGQVTFDHLYIYDGDDVLMEFTISAGDRTPNVAYLHGPQTDQVFAQDFGGNNYQWLLSDRQGSVGTMIGAAGAILDQIRYDAYGRITSRLDSSITGNYFYTGRTLDPSTGLYYYRARYYDPGLGRFISVDPTGFKGGDNNLYRYAEGDPANQADPLGLSASPSLGGWIAGDKVRGSYQNVSAKVWGSSVANPFQSTAMSFGESYKDNAKAIDTRVADSFRDIAGYVGFTTSLALSGRAGLNALVHGNIDEALRLGQRNLRSFGQFTGNVNVELERTLKSAGTISQHANKLVEFAGRESVNNPVTGVLGLLAAFGEHGFALLGSAAISVVQGFNDMASMAVDFADFGLQANGLASDRAQNKYYSKIGQAISQQGLVMTAKSAIDSIISDAKSIPELIRKGDSAKLGAMLGNVYDFNAAGAISKLTRSATGFVGKGLASIGSHGVVGRGLTALDHVIEGFDVGGVASKIFWEEHAPQFNTQDLIRVTEDRILDITERTKAVEVISKHRAAVNEYFYRPEVRARLEGLTHEQIRRLERAALSVEIARELTEPGKTFTFGKASAPDMDQYLFGIYKDKKTGIAAVRPDLLEESLVHRIKLLDDPFTHAKTQHISGQIQQLARVAGSELTPALRKFAVVFERLMGMEGAVGLPRVWEKLNDLTKEVIHNEITLKGKDLYRSGIEGSYLKAMDSADAANVLRKIEETWTRDQVMSDIAFSWALDPNQGGKFGVAAVLERGSFGASVEQFAFRASQIHGTLAGTFNPLKVLVGAKETNAYAWRTVADLFKTPMGGSSDFDFNVIVLNRGLFEKLHTKSNGHYADDFVNSFFEYTQDQLAKMVEKETSKVVKASLEKKLSDFQKADRYKLVEIYEQDDKIFRGIFDRRTAESANVAKGAHGYAVPLDRVNLGPLLTFDKYWYEGLRLRLGKVFMRNNLWYVNPTRIAYEGGTFTGRGTELQILDANYRLPELLKLGTADGVFGPMQYAGAGVYTLSLGSGSTYTTEENAYTLSAKSDRARAIEQLEQSTVLVLGNAALEHWNSLLGIAPQINVSFAIEDLPRGQLGLTRITSRDQYGRPTSGQIVIDSDASGLGWWMSDTISNELARRDGSESQRTRKLASLISTSISGFEGYDLSTVLQHEVGHLLGFTLDTPSFANRVDADRDGLVYHSRTGDIRLDRSGDEIDPVVHPSAIMASTLPIGRSKQVTEWDIAILKDVWTNSGELVSSFVGMEPNRLLETPTYGGFVSLSDSVGVALAKGPPIGLKNANFSTTDISSSDFGWSTVGNLQIANGAATLSETVGSMLTDLSQTFVLPAGVKQLKFAISGIRLDVGNNVEAGDAVEVALLDANRTTSRLPNMSGLTGSDALLSIQSDGRIYTSPGVSVSGVTSSGQVVNLTTPIDVTIDLSQLPAASTSTLYADLIGIGSENQSQVTLSNFTFVSGASLTWHNSISEMDVNGDGNINPIDALVMINELNARRLIDDENRLPVITSTIQPPPFYDVNNDGRLTPIDVLIVINYLNRESGGGGGGGGGLPTSWHNPVLALDVNNDGSITPIDALQVINEINQPKISDPLTYKLPAITNSVKPAPYLDVEENGFVTPIDVLQIINYLNAQSGGEGEESSGFEPDVWSESIREGNPAMDSLIDLIAKSFDDRK